MKRAKSRKRKTSSPKKRRGRKKSKNKKGGKAGKPTWRRHIWGIISVLLLFAVVGVSWVVKSNQAEVEVLLSKFDGVIAKFSPKVESLKTDIVNLQRKYYATAIEPLLKRVEKSVDGAIGVVKSKLESYRDKLASYLPEENWFTNTSTFPKMDIDSKFPIVVIPGTITSELEVWKGKDCIKSYRAKVWGEISMLWNFVKNKTCWLEHLKLDPETGVDPEGISVRPSAETVDYLFPGFWVWGIIIQELSKIGYNVNNLEIAAYDWRLGFRELEARDAYFTRLQAQIELFYKIHNQKTVVLAHSLGGLVWYHFMNWVEFRQPFWINKYIEACVSIGTPLLGVPKALSAVLSGEMKDSADLNAFDSILEKILSREERAQVFRSWRSNMEMLPKGEGVWGHILELEEETDNSGGKTTTRKIGVEDSLQFLKDSTDATYARALDNIFVGNLDVSKIDRNLPDDPKYWSNPFATTLPAAPFMKYYCFYGVGLDTEISYRYTKSNSSVFAYQLSFEKGRDTISYDPDGDGTVPYISMNYPCAKLWKTQKHNPANVPVIIREYPHQPVENVLSKRFDFRGGGGSGNHVNIMGNLNMIRDILRIAGGKGEDVEENIIVKKN